MHSFNFFRRKDDDVEIPNSTVFSNVQFNKESPVKNIIVVGTQHGEPCQSSVSKMLRKSDEKYTIILEKPSIKDLNTSFFTDTMIQIGGSDSTQDDVARIHRDNLQKKGYDIIGADGRKMYEFDGKTSNAYDISCQHKLPNDAYEVNMALIDSNVHSGQLIILAEEMLKIALGYPDVERDQIIKSWVDMIQYKDGTDITKILTLLWNRTNELSKNLSTENKELIMNHLLTAIKDDITKVLKSNDKINEQVIEYSQYLNDENQQIITQLGGIEIVQSLLDQGFSYSDLNLNSPEDIEYKVEKYRRDEMGVGYGELLDAVFLRACCDIDIYTQLMCNSKDNVIIIFGKNHTELLKDFLNNFSYKHELSNTLP